jgi:hypothetical protein
MSIKGISESRPDPKPFAELFNSPADFERVFDRLEHTIYWSFAFIDTKLLGRSPEITEPEVKRRFAICEKWFRIFRGEMGFGLVRTLDTIPRALAHELLSMPYDPHKENLKAGWGSRPADIQNLLNKYRLKES